jgi:gliding motility-associated-like protein
MPKLYKYLAFGSFFLLPFCLKAQVSGTVYNDVNGLTDNTVNGTGSNAGGLNAVLVDVTSGNVTATTAVAANGTYSFASVTSANYNVLITTNTATVGSAAPAVALPANWVVTGEFFGTGTGNDGTANGILPLGTTATAINANFGIEQMPSTNTSTATAQPNPGGTIAVTIAATNFGATDPDGGTIDSINIPTFPTNTTTLTINTTSYTSGTFPAGGINVATNTTGQPTQTISIDPAAGGITAVISYAAMDNALKLDATPGSLTIPFTDSISGKVSNDLNGLIGTPANTVDGAGTNAGGLNIVLVSTATNNVIATQALPTTGLYNFNAPNGSYTLLITTTTPTVGSTAPLVALPTNWVSTGENIGITAGNDGTIDGVISLTSIVANVVNADFGIEQRPNSNVFTAASQPNPGGTTTVAVNATGFSGTDPDGGTLDSLHIVSYPTNATSITINGNTYTAVTFPATGISIPTNAVGQPSQVITVDPVDGIVNVVFTYVEVDNAGKRDLTPGTLTLPFNPGFTVTDNYTALQLVQALTGSGVTVLNPTLNAACPGVAQGMFNYYGNPSDIGIDSGIILTSGRVVTLSAFEIGVNSPAIDQASFGFPIAAGDADLNALLVQFGSTSTTTDVCALEFDFVPAGDTIKFQYVFGSEEYPEYACSQFNDVFGFFISGPGYTGLTNIAKVPNTNIPVAINTINMGAGSNGTIGNCTVMGPGAPFGQYYVDNLGNDNQTIVYDGFTTVLTAVAGVTPCDTFHLKLAIGDASDDAFDSGVFLKAGSLSSAALAVKTYGGGGLEKPFTNTVRGCPAGVIRVSRNGGLAAPVTIPITYSGTAINGTDYVTLPPTVTIPAGDSVAYLFISGIPVSPAVGPKSAIISLISPYTCNGVPLVLSSDTIMIYDSIYVNIPIPDTAICIGDSINVAADADTFLTVSWTPAASVSNPTGLNVTLTPTVPTTYTLSVNIPGSLGTGCVPSSDHVFVDVKVTPSIDLGPEKITCGDSVQLFAHTTPLNPDETFVWSPAATLNNPEIRNPIAGPTGTVYYVVRVNPGAVGCTGIDSIKVRLLPDHITVLNNDTTVCAGTIVPLRAEGDTAFAYNWAPEIGIANPLTPNTTLNAQTTGYYTLTASYPGCLAMPDSFHLTVEPVPSVAIGPDKVICSYDTIQLYGSVVPANYPNYTFDWSPGAGLNDSTIKNPIFSADNSVDALTLKVTTPLGCSGADTIRVYVYMGDFLTVSPLDSGACPPARIQLSSDGAQTYAWSPSYGLSDADIANPLATPGTTTDYTLIGTKIYNGHACYDTGFVTIHVYPLASISLPDSVTIWPGESYQMDPQGNCLYFQWFPPSGLSATNISNPIAQPLVRTRYFVTASTENGCEVKDSIDVLVNTESALDVPNAFSPSAGDFKIVKRGIATLQYFRIFNRWGNKVFETSNIEKGWDGTYNGQPQPMGVYIYTVDATTSTGVPFKKGGNVTLIR